MATKPHHKAVLSALAAPERLKVFAAVVLGRGTAVEIAQETGIVQAKIEPLGRLVREGMIGKDRGRYGVIEGAFGEALARSAGESGTLSDDPRVDADSGSSSRTAGWCRSQLGETSGCWSSTTFRRCSSPAVITRSGRSTQSFANFIPTMLRSAGIWSTKDSSGGVGRVYWRSGGSFTV